MGEMIIMPGPHPPGLVEDAALAVAKGQSIPKFAEAHGISPRTVQRWATQPKFRRRVERLRRRLIDQSIGTLTHAATAAAVQLGKLATESKSESIRLSASRAILSDLLSARHQEEILRRQEEFAERLDALEREKNETTRRSTALPARSPDFFKTA